MDLEVIKGSQRQLAALALASVALLPSCNGGAGGDGGGGGVIEAVAAESEPNNTTGTADALALNADGLGEVDVAGDIDYWSISLTAGKVIRIGLSATRRDQSGWNGNTNVPRLTLLATNGTSKLLEHDYSGNFSDGWSWGAHDLDFPLFRVPATGTYFVGVTQDDTLVAGGDYAVRVNYVTLAGLQTEAEPVGTTGVNDTFGTAQAITPGTVHGWYVDGESDFYSFTTTAPSIVRFEMTAYRNGVHGGDDGYFDNLIRLFDTDGTTLLEENDDSFFYDAAIHYLLSTAGTYYVQVVELTGSLADGAYFLGFALKPTGTVTETEPNNATATTDTIGYGGRVTGAMATGDADYYRFNGKAGDMVRLQVFDGGNSQTGADSVDIDLFGPYYVPVLDSRGNGDLQTLTTILQETGKFHVRVTPDGSPVATSYTLELTRFKSALRETEPNGTIAEADPLNLSGRGSGMINPSGDLDLFRFTAAPGNVTTIAIYASDGPTGSNGFFELSGHGSSLDPLLTIRDGTTAVLATSTSSPTNGIYTEDVVDGLPTAAVSFVAPSLGTFYVEVADTSGSGGLDRYYVIERRK